MCRLDTARHGIRPGVGDDEAAWDTSDAEALFVLGVPRRGSDLCRQNSEPLGHQLSVHSVLSADAERSRKHRAERGHSRVRCKRWAVASGFQPDVHDFRAYASLDAGDRVQVEFRTRLAWSRTFTVSERMCGSPPAT